MAPKLLQYQGSHRSRVMSVTEHSKAVCVTATIPVACNVHRVCGIVTFLLFSILQNPLLSYSLQRIRWQGCLVLTDT